MAGIFDDLLPEQATQEEPISSGTFDDLIPVDDKKEVTAGKIAEQAGIGVMQGLYGIGRAGWGLVSHAMGNLELFGKKIDSLPETQSNMVKTALIQNSPALFGLIELAKSNPGKDIKDLAQEASTYSGEQGAILEQQGEEVGGGTPAWLARKVSGGLVSTAPALVAAPLGLPAAVTAAGLQSFGSTASDAFEANLKKGMSEDEARSKSNLPAVLSGLSTAAVTFLGGKSGPEGLGELVKNKGFRNFTKELFHHAGVEAGEETVDQFLQGTIERFTFNPEKTFEEQIRESFEAGLVGGFLGGGFHTLNHFSQPNEIKSKKDQKEEPSKTFDALEKFEIAAKDAGFFNDLIPPSATENPVSENPEPPVVSESQNSETPTQSIPENVSQEPILTKQTNIQSDPYPDMSEDALIRRYVRMKDPLAESELSARYDGNLEDPSLIERVQNEQSDFDDEKAERLERIRMIEETQDQNIEGAIDFEDFIKGKLPTPFLAKTVKAGKGEANPKYIAELDNYRQLPTAKRLFSPDAPAIDDTGGVLEQLSELTGDKWDVNKLTDALDAVALGKKVSLFETVTPYNSSFEPASVRFSKKLEKNQKQGILSPDEEAQFQIADKRGKLEILSKLLRRGSDKELSQRSETPRERTERTRIEASDFARTARRQNLERRRYYSLSFDKGKEHQVSKNIDGRIYKSTYPNKFGLTVAFDKNGEPKIFPASPVEYFKRLDLQNKLFGDDIQIEGLQSKKDETKVLTSQPFYKGRQATKEEIASYFKANGFEPSSFDRETAFENKDYLVFDAHEGNVRVLEDGTIMPFDVNIVEKKSASKVTFDEDSSFSKNDISKVTSKTNDKEKVNLMAKVAAEMKQSVFKNAPPIVIHVDSSTLPLGIKTSVETLSSKGYDISGLWNQTDGRVHILANGIKSENHLREVIRHEMLHANLKTHLKNDYNSILDHVYVSIPQDTKNQLMRSYDTELSIRGEEAARRLLAEEYLAKIAESDPQSSLWQQFVAAIKRILSKAFPDMKFSESDIRAIVHASLRSASLNSVVNAHGNQGEESASTNPPILPTNSFAMMSQENSEVDPNGSPLVILDAKGNPFASVPMKSLDDVKIIQMPELVELVKELTGDIPSLKKMRTALGQFQHNGITKGQVVLDPRIFADPIAAAKVLGHEIGHLIDYLPSKTMKRGNLYGRLWSLRNFMKESFGSTEVKNSEYRKELLALSQYWHPYDPQSVSESHRKYRESAVELYADAISVLFNSPATLKEMAPKFYRNFFQGLDAKPDVKKAFFELQTRLQQPLKVKLLNRETNIKAGFVKAEEIFLQKMNEAKAQRESWKGTLDQIKQHHYNIYQPIIDKQNRLEAMGVNVPLKERVDWMFDEHPMADNRIYRFLQRLQSKVIDPIQSLDIDRETLGQYLMLNRIATEEYNGKVEDALGIEKEGRRHVANPLGITPTAARLHLMQMKRDLGKTRFSTLERASERFHDLVFEVMDQGYRSGIFSKDIMERIIKPNRNSYATFVPLKYVDRYVPSGLYKSVGTLDEIQNPFTSTALKMITLYRAIQNQKAKKGVVDFLGKYFPAEIQAAEKINDGGRISFQDPSKKDRTKALFEIKQNGKIQGYVVDRQIAEMFEGITPAKADGVVRFLQTSFQQVVYPLIIRYNPIFQIFWSPMRDFQRLIINAPAGTTRKISVEYLKELGRVMFNAKESAVRARLDNKPNDLIQEMQSVMAIGSPFDSFARSVEDIDSFDAILQQFHLLPDEQKSKFWNTTAGKGIASFLKKIEYTGQVFESLPKVSTYKVLTSDLGMHSREAANYVRNHVGCPNYLKKGKHSRIVQSIFPFYSVFVNGWQSDISLATGQVESKSAANWWFKWAAFGGAYAVLSALAESGMFGDDLEKLFGGMSDYDKTQYLNLPLGSLTGGDYGEKSVYLRVPQDETQRVINGLLRLAIVGTAKAVKGEQDPTSNRMFGFLWGQTPSLTPFAELVQNWATYAMGQNPIDQFRGTPILSNAEHLTRGWDAKKTMLQWTISNTGALTLLRFNTDADTTLEMTVGNIPLINKMLKVSDAGFREKQFSSEKQEDIAGAEFQLSLPKETRKIMSEYNFLKGLGQGDRTLEQQRRYAELSMWNRAIYKPLREAIISSEAMDNSNAAESFRKTLVERSKDFEEKR